MVCFVICRRISLWGESVIWNDGEQFFRMFDDHVLMHALCHLGCNAVTCEKGMGVRVHDEGMCLWVQLQAALL